MSKKSSTRFTPVVIAVSVVIGILIGTFYAKHFAGSHLGIVNGSSNKLNALLRIIDDQYVDTVSIADLVEKAMPQVLAKGALAALACSSQSKTIPSMSTRSSREAHRKK